MTDEISETPDEVEGLNEEVAEAQEGPSSPSQTERPARRRWVKRALVATGGAATAVLGVRIAVASSKAGQSPVTRGVGVRSHAATAVRRSLDHQVPVRQHVRRQPYGPNRSLIKEIIIREHVRGPKTA